MVKWLIGIIGFAVVSYGALVAVVYGMQDRFIFEPFKTEEDPRSLGLDDTVVSVLETRDGERLAVWHRPADPGYPTVLYFHGNAYNLARRADRFQIIADAGFGYYAASYRGYGESSGAPSEQAILADALIAFDHIAAKADGPIIVYGESLGSGVASYVGSQRTAAAVVLEAPYTSVLEMARRTMPWIPVDFLLRHRFRSDRFVQTVEEPLLIVHGTEDKVIPFNEGESLFELVGEPKRFVAFEGAGHNNLWDAGSFQAVLEFLKDFDVWQPPEGVASAG